MTMHVNYSGNHLTYGGQTGGQPVPQNQGQTGGQPVAQAPFAAPIAPPITPQNNNHVLPFGGNPPRPVKTPRGPQLPDLKSVKKHLQF